MSGLVRIVECDIVGDRCDGRNGLCGLVRMVECDVIEVRCDGGNGVCERR